MDCAFGTKRASSNCVRLAADMFIFDWLSQAVAILILIGDVIHLNFSRRIAGLPPPAAPAMELADMLEHERRARQRFPNRLPIIITTIYGKIRAACL